MSQRQPARHLTSSPPPSPVASPAVLEPQIDPPWRRSPLSSTLVSNPTLHGNTLAYAADVLRSGWWGYGPVARHLEAAIRELYAERNHALATSSCTAAMHLALGAAGIGPDDEVIVPAFTYVSTAAVARYCGASPVFADVDPASLTLTAATVEPLLSERTRAIMAVHYAGPASDFDPIRALVADRKGPKITVIEDCAHAFGSTDGRNRVGARAEFAAFSFAPTKQIASSNGGILLFRDGDRRTELAQRAFLGLAADTFQRTLAGQGSCCRGSSPVQHVARDGHKYKIDDLAAAVAMASIERLDEIVAQRGALARRYYEELARVAEVELQRVPPDAGVSWYILPIRVPADARERLRDYLALRRIDTTVHYPNLLEQPAFAGSRGIAPVAAQESRRVISLPLHGQLDLADVERICAAVRGFFG